MVGSYATFSPLARAWLPFYFAYWRSFFEGLFGLPALISFLFPWAVMIPSIAIVVRRLHDIDKSGGWYLLIFTIVGAFVVLYWLCSAGDERDNQYGSDPLKNSE
jgi:uncharacterized membrane protein YhaH (DUF805 family)